MGCDATSSRSPEGGSYFEWYRDVAFLAWICKDLGWVLLVWPISLPAATISIVIQAHCLWHEWPQVSADVRVHNSAEFLWLTGNIVWMIGEDLFDQKSQHVLPWYWGPALPQNAVSYQVAAYITMALFTAGLLLLVGYYLLCMVALGRRGLVNCDLSISMRLYTALIIGPWICKDICWNLEYFNSLVFFYFVVLCLAVDYVRLSKDMRFGAVVLWVTANAIWAVSELALDAKGVRFFDYIVITPSILRLWSGVFLALAAMMVWPSIAARGRQGQAQAGESSALLLSRRLPRKRG